MSKRWASAVFAASFASFMAASSAPTPLYQLYQQAWGFSPVMLTVIYAVYSFSLLAALLVVGGLSDYIGRRPVILGALIVQIFVLILFLAAQSTGMLLVARLLQGFAAGAATSALSAAVLDVNKQHGPLMNSLCAPSGLGLGTLVTGLLVGFAPWPLHLIFFVLLTLTLIQLGLIWALPESGQTRPGAWASLQPRLAVPRAARAMFWRVTPINIAVWGLGGFFLSLSPSLLRATLPGASPLLGGAGVALFAASGCVSILALRKVPAAILLPRMTLTVMIGVAIMLGSLHLSSAAGLGLGVVIAGFGWGGSFLGVLRNLLPLAGAEGRAGLMASYYIESYLAMSVPAILAGLATRHYGLLAATDVYGAGLILLAGLALIPTKLAAP